MLSQSSLIEVVLGAIIAIGMTILLERLRRPKLEIQLVTPATTGDREFKGKQAEKVRFLYLKLVNKKLRRWGRPFVTRSPALECHGHITFHHRDDGKAVFDRTMQIRWPQGGDPTLPLVTPDGYFVVDGKPVVMFDPQRLGLATRVNISPGESQKFDVVARFDDEDECYGWSNDSYIEGWRNPDWKLDKGRYLVKVTIFSAGEECSGTFYLNNEVGQKDFRLEEN
jgi:hypothetical protein